MNISYMLYQAEHTKSAREQREADLAAGRLAASLGRRQRPSGRRVAGGRAASRQPAVLIPRQACPCHDLAARM